MSKEIVSEGNPFHVEWRSRTYLGAKLDSLKINSADGSVSIGAPITVTAALTAGLSLVHSGTTAGFFGATPAVQPSTTGQTAGFTAGSSTPVLNDSTFTGGVGSKAYTIGDVVKALKTLGLLKST